MTPDQFAKIQENADRVARLMDDIIRIPGTNIRLGWDSILGLVPGIGDLVTLSSHGYLVWQAFRARARKRVYAKMMLNAGIDFIVGVIPGVGDLVDVFWKSNRKNAELLRREIAHQISAGAGRRP